MSALDKRIAILIHAEAERERLALLSETISLAPSLPDNLLTRYETAVRDLEGILRRDPAGSRMVLQDVLGGRLHLSVVRSTVSSKP